MDKTTRLIAILGVGLLILLVVGLSGGWGWGMMGTGAMGYSFGPIAMLAMLGMWLFPVGLIALLVIGTILLAQRVAPPTIGQTCPSCGRAVRASDRHCSNCGTPLKK